MNMNYIENAHCIDNGVGAVEAETADEEEGVEVEGEFEEFSSEFSDCFLAAEEISEMVVIICAIDFSGSSDHYWWSSLCSLAFIK